MSDKSEDLPALGGTWRDAAAAVLVKGGLGAIPVVGPIVAEVVGLIIPNQRLARIEAYLMLLGKRLQAQDPSALRARFNDPDTVDLFEEGVVQSLRAISGERKAYIAAIVASGISGEARDRIEAKRLLKLLAAIDDDQVVILTSHLHRHRHDDDFWKRHEAVLEPEPVHLGSSQDELDASALHELARAELLRLSLLAAEFKTPRKGEPPEFDDATGMMKVSSHDLTPLGRLLLTRIGLAELGEL